RAERARDDPFYIAPDAGGGGEAGGGSGRLTPFGQVLRGAADQTGLDIDSIPMMPVEIDSSMLRGSRGGGDKLRKKKRKPRIIDIMGDETIEVEGDSTTTTTTTTTTAATTPASQARARRAQAQAQAQSSPAVARVQGRPHPPSQPSLLQFDAGSAAEQRYHDLSSSASMSMPMPSSLSPLSGHQQSGTMAGTDLSIDIAAVERSAEAEEQMAQALADLQRKRLEMQRERERVPLSAEVPEEGILVEPVKKKKKKKKKVVKESDAGSDGATTKMKKKKHKRKEAKEEEGKITGASSSLVEEKPREEAAAQGQDNEAPAPDRPAGTEPS
ncbi:AP-3 complex subunit delta, partial [Ascosphaera acerosa]